MNLLIIAAAVLLAGGQQDEAEELVGRLRSQSLVEREEAVRKLKELGEAAVPALERAAKHIDPEVAAQARYVLRFLDVRKVLGPDVVRQQPALLERLVAGGPREWVTAFLEFAGRGRRARPRMGRRSLSPQLRKCLDALADRAVREARTREERFAVIQVVRRWMLAGGVPALVTLVRDGDPDILRQAVQAMRAAVGAKKAIACILPLLEDPDPNIRVRGLEALARTREGTAVTHVEPLLQDNSPLVRAKAIAALTGLGAVRSLQKILPLLKDPDAWVRVTAIHSVTRFGRKAFAPAILPLLQDEDDDVALAAARALTGMGATEAAPEMVAFLKRTATRQEDVLQSLGMLGAPETVPDIVPFLRNRRGEVRAAAAWALGEMEAAEAAPQVAELLEDPDHDALMEAAAALGRMRAREYAPRLAGIMRDAKRDPYARVAALASLAVMGGKRADGEVSRFLTDETVPADLREEALYELYEVNSAGLTPALVSLLTNDSEELLQAAAEILSNWSVPEIAPMVVPLIGHKREFVHYAALTVLDGAGIDTAVAEVMALYAGAGPGLRQEMSELLFSFITDDGPAKLIPYLGDPDAAIRSVALAVLSRYEVDAAAPDIVPLLEDKDEVIREAAYHALLELRSKNAAPRLVLLLKNRDGKLREKVLTVLDYIEAEIDPKAILPLLADPNPDVRAAAEDMLVGSDWNRPENFTPLLKDADPALRAGAAAGLGRAGEEKHVPLLLPLLGDESPLVRLAAVRSLGALATDAEQIVPRILPFLADRDPHVRIAALEALGGMDADTAVDRIAPLLKDPHPGVRRNAAGTLGRLGASQMIPQILPLLRENDRDVRLAALNALCNLRAPQVVDPLIDMLQEDDAILVVHALRLLTQVGDTIVVPKILPLLDDGDRKVRRSALQAIVALSTEKVVPDLVRCAAGARDEVADAIRDTLRRIGREPAVPYLRPFLKDGNAARRRFAVEMLTDLAARGEAAAIALLLGDGNPGVLLAALDAVAAFAHREAAPGVERLLDHPDEAVRWRAAAALEKLKAGEKFEETAALLKSARPDVRAFAAEALGRLGHPDAAPLLLPLLKDPDPAVRIRAAAALCRLGDRAGVPVLLREAGNDLKGCADHLNTLNVVFFRETWNLLSCTPIKSDIKGTMAEIILSLVPAAVKLKGVACVWGPDGAPQRAVEFPKGTPVLEVIEKALEGTGCCFLLRGRTLQVVPAEGAFPYWRSNALK
ncbi:MAG: HEAT repeat domain-containing protein [Planctomycetota bacterium]|jgi:HEAT repeat protein